MKLREALSLHGGEPLGSAAGSLALLSVQASGQFRWGHCREGHGHQPFLERSQQGEL